MLTFGYVRDWKKWFCHSDSLGYFHKNKQWGHGCGENGFWKSLDSLVSLLKKKSFLTEGTKVQFVQR